MEKSNYERAKEIENELKLLSTKKNNIKKIIIGFYHDEEKESTLSFFKNSEEQYVRFFGIRDITIKIDPEHIKDGLSLELARVERKITSLEIEFKSL